MSIVPPEILAPMVQQKRKKKTPALNPNLQPPLPQAPNEVVPHETSRFNYPGSDIVLRSRDSYNFPLPKLYIVLCSPVLRNLIESVSNTSDVPDGEEPNGEEREAPSLPVVEIPESKETLYRLLTFIFPVTLVLPPTADTIMELLAVAQKYEMDSVVSHIRGAIARQDPPFLRLENAFHVYFLAQRYGLHQEAVQAARVTLRFPMVIEGLGDKLDSAYMTGAFLHELWKYHEQVRSELKSALLQFRNSGLPDDLKSLMCRRPSYGSSNPPQWLYDYINSIAGTPHLFDLTEFEDVRARHVQSYGSSYGCSCATMPIQVRRSFWEALTAVVYRTLEKVRRIGAATPHHRG
jgi:hypothetical protein